MGLGTHRRKSKRHAAAMASAPIVETKPNGKPDHPARSDTFLCSRNCGATFPLRDALRVHEAAGTCRPKPTPPPTREFRISSDTPAGFIAGMGE